jgi:hypothetical protein
VTKVAASSCSRGIGIDFYVLNESRVERVMWNEWHKNESGGTPERNIRIQRKKSILVRLDWNSTMFKK